MDVRSSEDEEEHVGRDRGRRRPRERERDPDGGEPDDDTSTRRWERGRDVREGRGGPGGYEGGPRGRWSREWRDGGRPRRERSPSPRSRYSGRYADRTSEWRRDRGGRYEGGGGRARSTSPQGKRSRYEESNSRRDPFAPPMMNFKQFMANLEDDDVTPTEAERRYDAYKSEFQYRHGEEYFRSHKAKEWFLERYHPSHLTRKKDARLRHARAAASGFIDGIKSGVTVWGLTYNLSRITPLPGVEYAVTVEPGEDGLKVNVEVKRDSSDDEGEKKEQASKDRFQPPFNACTLFVPNLPATWGSQELCELVEGIVGCVKRAVLSEAFQTKATVVESGEEGETTKRRMAFVLCTDEDKSIEAREALEGKTIGDHVVHVTIQKPHDYDMHRNALVAPRECADSEQVSHDLTTCRKLITKLDEEKKIDGGASLERVEGKEIEILDHLITYLRLVHLFCFYCGEEFWEEDELVRRCGPVHYRRGATDAPVSTDGGGFLYSVWRQQLDAKLKDRLEGSGFEAMTGETLVEQRANEWLEAHTEKLEEEKYKCGVEGCTKKFKGAEFVQKHLQLKHTEEFETAKDLAVEEQFFNNYKNDPHRLRPTQRTAVPSAWATGPKGDGLLPSPSPFMALGSGSIPPDAGGLIPVMPIAPAPHLIPIVPIPQATVVPFLDERRGRGRRSRGPKGRPTTGEGDPRAGGPPRTYVDLDAMTDEGPTIDYRVPDY